MKSVRPVVLLVLFHSSIGAVQVFYVGSTTECSSTKSSPCYSLQYHFTDNSIFHFLPGDHQLETVVTIRNVVNLSLVGASSEAKILCNSAQSGFSIEEFYSLTIENITISDCSYDLNTNTPASGAIFLRDGSELSLNHVTMSNMYAVSTYYKGLLTKNVTGSFSIRNSAFYTPGGYSIAVLYPLSGKSSYFEFSGNEVSSYVLGLFLGLFLGVYTPNVQAEISDSNFKLDDLIVDDIKVSSLQADFVIVTNNSIQK